MQGTLAECQIPRRELEAVRALGAGQFGEVYLAKQRTDGGSGGGDGDGARMVLRAVKMLRGAATAADKAEFMGEATIMNAMRHKNIVSL